MKQSNLPWPYFRGMWAGLWGGVMAGILIGTFYGNWFATRPSANLVWGLIFCGVGVVAFLPEAVAQIAAGVHRYRIAAAPGRLHKHDLNDPQ